MLTAAVLIANDRSGRLILSLLVSNIGLGMVTLALPLYLHAQGRPVGQIGLVMSLPGVGMLPFELLWGWLADRVPAAALLLISRLTFAAIVVGIAVTAAVVPIGLLYLFGTSFLVAAAPVGRGYLNSAVRQEHRGLAQGMHQAQWTLGTSIGAAVAGLFLSKFGFTTTFMAAAAFPIVGAGMSVYAFRDNLGLTLSKVVPTSREVPLTHAYQWRLMILTSLVVTCLLVSVSGMSAFLPLLITGQLHQSAANAGLVVALLGLITVLALLIMGHASDLVGPRSAMVIGLALTAVGIGTAGIATDMRILMIALALAGIGTAFAWPSATASLAQSGATSRHGLIMGLYGGFENVGNIVGPLIAGAIWASRGGPSAAFLALALSAMVGSGLGLALKWSWSEKNTGRPLKANY